MMRYYLPRQDVFNRYQVGRTRFNLIKGYHRRLAEKHRWFVRPYLSKDAPYYIDGTLLDVIDDANHEFIEIFDCAWSSENWLDTPWKYNVNPQGFTEIYCAERSDPHARGYNVQEIGYKRQPSDIWVIKFFDDNKGKSAWINEMDGTIRARNGGIIYRWDGEEHLAGTFGNELAMKRAPDDVVIPVLRSMGAGKWRGFYDDSIDYIIEITGIRRATI